MIETTDFVKKENTADSIHSDNIENNHFYTLNNFENSQKYEEIETSDFEQNSNILVENQENENPLENLENSSSEPHTIEIEDANTTNCLALTIQKDHKLVAIKNVFFKSIRMTWKIIVSTITLSILKLFS